MKLPIFNLHRPAVSSVSGAAEKPVAFSETLRPSSPSDRAVPLSLAARLRRQLLDRLLIITIILGSLIFLVILPMLIEAQNWMVLGFYSLLLIGLIALRLTASLAYSSRSAIFLVMLAAAAGFLLADERLSGNGRLLFLLVPLYAIFLLVEGRFARTARGSVLILSIILLAGTALLASRAYLPGFDPGLQANSWMVTGFGFGLIAIIGAWAFNAHLRGLETGLEASENRQRDFADEQKRLKDQSRLSTQALEHRLVQIRTAGEITRTISSTLELNRLLPQVCNLICDRFGLYYAGAFLVEPGSDEAVLAAGTGEAGRQMLEAGHHLRIGGDSMIGWATANRRPRIALDVNREDSLTSVVRFNNPFLPETRSELALPIVSQQNILGALTIQSTVEAAFDQDDLTVLQSIADSLANAIQNARLFEQVQSNLDEISTLHRQYLHRAWMQVLETQGPQEFVYLSEAAGRNGSSETHPFELPIRLRDQVIGKFALETSPNHPIGTEEQALIEAVVNQASLALENARLLDETRQRADREVIASDISTRIWSSSDIDTILRTALQELGSSLDAVQGSIELWPEALSKPDPRLTGEHHALLGQGEMA